MRTQEEERQIPAESEATVVRICMLPGSQIKADTILVEDDKSSDGTSHG